ncbi:MAG: hypothetical protein WC802_02285 [Patescibacteria group bacterium]|jgi:hypothetical protein
MKPTSTAVQTTTQTQTSTKVGVALLGLAGLAAAAGFVIASAAQPTLIIRMTPQPASHVITSGTELDPVLGFTLQAQNIAMKVNRLVFTATSDTDGTFASVENNVSPADHISLCGIYDASSHLIGQGQIIDSSGRVTFTNLGLNIPANSGKTMRLRCTFSDAYPDGSSPDIYAFSLKNDADVTAVGPQGNSIPGSRIYLGGQTDPGVNTALATTVTVKDYGVLSAGMSATSPWIGIVVAGDQTRPTKVASFTLSSTNEDYTVRTLTIKQAGQAQAVAYAYLSYRYPDGTLGTNSMAFVNGVARFTGMAMPIQAGAANAQLLDVSVSAPAINATTGATSGMTIEASLDFATPGSFSAVANTSGHTQTEAGMGSSLYGNPFKLYKTKPTVSLSTSSPSGASIPGREEVLRFNVAADPGGDVSMSQFTFKINATDNANNYWASCGGGTYGNKLGDVSKWELKDITSGNVETNALSWYIADNSGTRCGPDDRQQDPVVYALVNLLNNNIPAGTTHTFSLTVDTTGASSSLDDKISVSIPTDPANLSPLLHNLQWRETLHGQDLLDGAGVYAVPVTGGTLVF